MPYRLRITGPDERSFDVALAAGETRIGRAPDCEVVLDGRGVSRQHAILSIDGDHLGLRDLRSRFGTLVNDQPISSTSLHVGDRIMFGVFQAVLLATGSARRTKPGPAPSVQLTDEGSSEAVQAVFPRANSDMLGVMERISRQVDQQKSDVPSVPQLADYRALLLMCRVSDALARSHDLRDFLELVADLCIDELKADTVVILRGESLEHLTPILVRHEGELGPGEIPVSKTMLLRALHDRATVMLTDADSNPALGRTASISLLRVRAAIATPLIVTERTAGVLYLARRSAPFDRQAADWLTALSALIAASMERAELRDRLRREEEQRKALERFHPPEVVSEVVRAVRAGNPGLAEHEASALAVDLYGYANLEPRDLAELLGAFYALIYEVVFSNGGALVNVWGGRALAIFGVPKASKGDAQRACVAALALRDGFRALKRNHKVAAHAKLRVALDAGTILAGPVGAPERFEYTALGEPVNVAMDLAARGPDDAALATERVLKDINADTYRVRSVERAYGAAETSVYELVGEARQAES